MNFISQSEEKRERMSDPLCEAAKATGRNKSTILRAIKAGVMSATRDPVGGGWQISPPSCIGFIRRWRPPLQMRPYSTATQWRSCAAVSPMRTRIVIVGSKTLPMDNI